MIPEADDPVLVDDLPDMSSIAEVLNADQASVIKWVVQNDSVHYVHQDNFDWEREFTAFVQDNVNRLRFKDAYEVTDSTTGGVRVVSFTALNDGQEVRKMTYTIELGQLVDFIVIKERSNLLSASQQSFTYSSGRYSIKIRQKIDGIFQNVQEVHGVVVPRGEVWRGVFELVGGQMPVTCILQNDRLIVKNDREELSFLAIDGGSDSLVFTSEFFNGRFQLWEEGNTMTGLWINDKYDARRTIPVRFEKGIPYRFSVSKTADVDISGEHALLFHNPDSTIDSTILVIEQNGHKVCGSVLTETGDYRWLEGVVRNDSVYLSTMDGAHAYLFYGAIEGDEINGIFAAGTTWKQSWTAYIDQSFGLRSPEAITKLQQDSFTFSFPDAEGNVVSLDDERFANKVVLVTIMGTWCSNCLDESLFLKKVRDQYPASELEIVALDFELVSDSAKAIKNIQRHVDGLGIDYPVLLASLSTNKAKASSLLPSLNGVFSYPTLIVLDRNHEVVRIHTGFNGPATGKERYQEFESSYLALINSLVNN